MFKANKLTQWLLPLLVCIPLVSVASTPVKSIVIFGDSVSDNGNTTHLLKSLRQEESPAFITAPFKAFVINKMVEFANDYYVPQVVLDAGVELVRGFFDKELAPMIATLVSKINVVPLMPAKPYWNWRFSNGLVWNEYLASMLSISTQDADRYTNRAFGGSFTATYDNQLTVWNLIRHPINTIKSLIVGKLVPPSLGLSVQAYLLEQPKLNSEAVYFIFSGLSDYVGVLQFEDNYNPAIMHQYVNNVVANLSNSVRKLSESGAKQFVILGINHLGNAPKFYNTLDKEVLNAATSMHNSKVKAQVDSWKVNHPKADFLFINPQDLLEKVQKNPDHYGITQLNTACVELQYPLYERLKDSAFANNPVLLYTQMLNHIDKQFAKDMTNYQVCDTPEQHLYWDDIHLSTKGHAHLAFEICKAMEEHGYDVSCISPEACTTGPLVWACSSLFLLNN